MRNPQPVDIARAAVVVLVSLAACAKKSDSQPQHEADAAQATDASADQARVATVEETAQPQSPPAPDDVAAAPDDATKTPSGLAYKVLQPGDGQARPGPTDTVEVHYTGWTTDGKMFDSSVTRGRAARFPLGGVIKGWTEGLQLMSKGEKTRFWIPADLAYGATPARPGAPAGMLVFDVELLDIAAVPQAPSDVASPPAEAKKTASGLAYKVLKPGAGEKRPKATDTVEVHYTGWTTDGKMFDSSTTRGRTVTFPLNRVIKGWTEGLQLMREGEKTRFWIPADLGYGAKPARPGAPAGMLVFDIELVSVR